MKYEIEKYEIQKYLGVCGEWGAFDTWERSLPQIQYTHYVEIQKYKTEKYEIRNREI
jgi:hypothetical protein